MYSIAWDDFNQEYPTTQPSPDQSLHPINLEPLPDDHCIWLTEARLGDPALIEVVFKLGDRVSWWKESRRSASQGRRLANRA
jgi:hypothetical protein